MMDGCAGTPPGAGAGLSRSRTGRSAPTCLHRAALSLSHSRRSSASPGAWLDPRQLLPWGCSSLHMCHLDGRAWKSPSGTSPTLVSLGSRSPGIHIGVDASSLLVFSRTAEPKWTGNGSLGVCPFLPLILD